MSPVTRVLLAVTIAILAPADALAGSDGVKIKVEDNHDKYKYEYRDPYCKFKYEFHYAKGKEKIEEEGDCPRFSELPQFDPPVARRAAVVPAPPPRRSSQGDFCDRALAGAVIGATVGGAVGSQIGSGDRRVAAIILGGVIGGVLGHEIGRRIDEADRHCLARTLEYADPGVEVGWTNPASNLRYDLRSLSGDTWRGGEPCRMFEMRVDGGPWRDAEACRRRDGTWELVSMR